MYNLSPPLPLPPRFFLPPPPLPPPLAIYRTRNSRQCFTGNWFAGVTLNEWLFICLLHSNIQTKWSLEWQCHWIILENVMFYDGTLTHGETHIHNNSEKYPPFLLVNCSNIQTKWSLEWQCHWILMENVMFLWRAHSHTHRNTYTLTAELYPSLLLANRLQTISTVCWSVEFVCLCVCLWLDKFETLSHCEFSTYRLHFFRI